MPTPKCDHTTRDVCQLCRARLEWQPPRNNCKPFPIDFLFGDTHVRVIQGGFDAREHGLWLWSSGVALATILHELGPLDGLRVLEVGPGLGLAGLLAAKRGAKVTFADKSTAVCGRLHEEVEANVVSNVTIVNRDMAEFDGGFEIVLGSDCLYERDTPARLAKTLSTQGPIAAFVDPWRAGDTFATALESFAFPFERATESYARYDANALVRVENRKMKPDAYDAGQQVFAFDVFRKI